jgi:glycosyltransferase involved in cell wall biosynthesis
MKIIMSHPSGNQNVRAVALALAEAGLLAEFHTSLATFPGRICDRLGGWRRFSAIRRRQFHPTLEPLTHSWPWREAGRLAATRIGCKRLTRHEVGPLCIDAVYRGLDRRVAARSPAAVKRGVEGVYAYEDGALESFTIAKTLGLKCIYDLPIGYWRAARRLLEREQARWPDWASTLVGLQDSAAKLARKDEELRLADLIITASSFTAGTLRDFPGDLAPVKVIPYGFPTVSAEARPAVALSASRPLRLLFVGGLSQRKGIADVFAAVERLGRRVELTVVGRKGGPECPALDVALARHRWIPSLPHHEILKLMRENDVLLFPSLFEGFGLVITEAMSQGTPVITTDRTAGPDLIKHGQNGWLIKAGSTEALTNAIENLLSQPEQIAEAGRAAQVTAAQRPWSVYGRELAAAVRALL